MKLAVGSGPLLTMSRTLCQALCWELKRQPHGNRPPAHNGNRAGPQTNTRCGCGPPQGRHCPGESKKESPGMTTHQLKGKVRKSSLSQRASLLQGERCERRTESRRDWKHRVRGDVALHSSLKSSEPELLQVKQADVFWKAVLAAVWNPGKSESRQDKRVSGEQGRGSYTARAGGRGRPLRPGRDGRVTPLPGGAGTLPPAHHILASAGLVALR